MRKKIKRRTKKNNLRVLIVHIATRKTNVGTRKIIFIVNNRSKNPFSNAFHDFEYIEPDEEQIKISEEIFNKYLLDQEQEEKEWFIKQEQELLKQLIQD